MPNVLFNDSQMIPDQRIMNYLDVHLDITRGEIETLLSITKGQAITLINKRIKDHKLEKKRRRTKSYIY